MESGKEKSNRVIDIWECVETALATNEITLKQFYHIIESTSEQQAIDLLAQYLREV